MTHIHTYYDLLSEVCIKQLETTGRVIGIYLSETSLQYRVRYFYNGEAKTVYFFADELSQRIKKEFP